MKHVKIELPNEIHKRLKSRCVKKEVTMKEFLIQLIIKEVKRGDK